MSPEGDDQSLKKAPPVTASPIVPSPVLVAELPCGQNIVQECVQEIGKEVAELPCAISTTTNNHRACGY